FRGADTSGTVGVWENGFPSGHGGDDMSTALTTADYERLAQEYLARLPREHFMEATPQARQREVTVESLALLRTRRRDLHYFNKLLVQYFFRRNLRQVVPDNFAILTDAPEQARTSYV